MKRKNAGRASRSVQLVEALEGRTLLAVDFTLATLSDTQYTVETFPQLFKTQTAWIAAHKTDPAYKVAFFTHQGDMLRRGYANFQAQNASDALANLDPQYNADGTLKDAGVPYAVAIGNHDYDNQFDDLDRHVSSANFASWFGDARYKKQVTAGAISEYGSSLDQRNHYSIFTVAKAGGGTQKLLVLSLEWQVPTAAQAWAQSVIDAHSNLPVIVSTHEYLAGTSGSRTTGTPVDAAVNGAQNGSSLWTNFVSKNDQIFMVLSGHTGATWSRTVTNNAGHTVIEAAADFEGAQPNGGDGWMQTLQFDLGTATTAGSVKITSLRPTSATTQTLGTSVTYSVNFATRFALGAAPAPVTPPANDAPTAPAVALATRESTAVTFNPLAGAQDKNQDVLKAFPTSLPPGGAIYVNDSGTFTYTPDPKFVGTDTFTYVVSDGKAISAPVTVTVTVTAAPPVYYYPTAEQTVAGHKTAGTLASLQSSDNMVESIDEVITSGADVDQRYTFSNVLAGADKLVAVNAWRSYSNPGTGDEYHPAYSTNGGSTWTDLTLVVARSSHDVTRTRFEAAEPYQLWALPASVGGNVQIRFTDVNTSGTETVDTLTVDEIFIRALDTQGPTAPANLTAAAASATTATLAWTGSGDNVGVAGYDIYRAQAGGDVLVGTTAGTSATVGGLTPGVAAVFYVVARDAAGNVSGASNQAGVTTTTPDDVPPTAPLNVRGTAAAATASIAWDAASDDVGVAAYVVYRDGTAVGTVDGGTLAFTDTGLAQSANYTYTVVARDAAGNVSAASDAVTVVTTADTLPPTAPTNVTASGGTTTVALSWSAASDDVGVSGYQVYQAGPTGDTLAGTTAGTSLTVSGLAVNGTYTFYVVAVDGVGNASPASALATATTADTHAPSAPAGLTATAGKTSIALSWGAASDDVGVTAYDVYRNGAVLSAGVTGTAYTDATPVGGTSYTYTVVARDAAGNASPASNAAKTATPVPAPTNLVATKVKVSGNKSGAKLTWTDNSSTETGFKVYSSRDGVNWSLLTTTAANATTYTTGALATGSWFFKVVGTNANGDSDPSNVFKVTI